MNLPKRKSNRLEVYDYNTEGSYFVTICTAGKKKILSNLKFDNLTPINNLTEIGELIKTTIEYINENFAGISIEKYVIMPNHIHLIINIDEVENPSKNRNQQMLSKIISSIKKRTYKILDKSIWQASYYEHIIRDERDYYRVTEYIENNPYNWKDDEYFI